MNQQEHLVHLAQRDTQDTYHRRSMLSIGLIWLDYQEDNWHDLVDLEPITDDTIDVKDNETNDDDISDVNISSPKRHQQLQKDFKKMNESIGRKVTVKEVVKWMKKLEEYRYRKVKSVDARRVASFINNGLSETDLPTSLQKKWSHAKYGKEKHLADKFIKQQIQNKLMTAEEKMPKLKDLLGDI